MKHAVASLLLAAVTALASASAPAQDDSAFRTKAITKVAPRAAVMLEKNCPVIVQPYDLADNAASMGLFIGESKMKEVAQQVEGALKGWLGGQKNSAAKASFDVTDNTRKAAKQLNWLPMSAEVAFGERLHAEQAADILGRDGKFGKPAYAKADSMMRDLLAGVGEPTAYNFQLFILKNDARNAVARPGGFVYIDEGLVEDPKLEPKAYFALAHEIAHVLQRHETKELENYAIDSISASSDLKAAIVSVSTSPDTLLAKVQLQKGQFTRYYIDQELQADACAARILARALPDRKALAAALQAFIADLPTESTLSKAPSSSGSTALDQRVGAVDDLVNTPIARHPINKERVDNLRSVYAEITGPSAPRP